jgi:hypothetical protein
MQELFYFCIDMNKKDRYLKVSPKWWNDTLTGKWIHDNNIHKYLFSDNQRSGGTNLPKFHRNTSKNKMY